MSESSGEKTEQPTQKKLNDARKKGQIAQSQDINKLFITVVGFEIIISLNGVLIEKLKHLIVTAIDSSSKPFEYSSWDFAESSLTIWLTIVLIFFPAIIIARFISGFVQYGFLFTPESLKLDFKKFSPASNLKNIITKKKFVELLNNLIKFSVLALIFFQIIRIFLSSILLLPNTSLDDSVTMGVVVFSYMARLSLGMFFIIAIYDFFVQKSIFVKSQKMTKDEVFREYKQMEGDPQIKGERRALAQEPMNSGGETRKQVEQSDAIVVNPTHFAVAIEYKPGKTPLPVIKCKGVDDKALEMKKIAEENNIPIIRYISLARTLIRVGTEDKFIPRQCLEPMAKVFLAIRAMELEDSH